MIIKNLAVQVSDPREMILDHYYRIEGSKNPGVEVAPREDGNFYVGDVCAVIPALTEEITISPACLTNIGETVDSILVDDRDEITSPFRETIRPDFNDKISSGSRLTIIFNYQRASDDVKNSLLRKGKVGRYERSGAVEAPKIEFKLPPSKFGKKSTSE